MLGRTKNIYVLMLLVKILINFEIEIIYVKLTAKHSV